MSKYKVLSVVETWKSNKIEGLKVQIVKVQKEGTKRIFFQPRNMEGKTVSRYYHSTKWEAVKFGKHYIKWKEEKLLQEAK